MGYATGSDQQDYWRRAVGDVTRARLERDVPELVRLLGAPRALVGDKGHLLPDVRDYALRALRKVGDERAVPALTRMLLDDPQESARMGAAQALGAIGDRRALTEQLADAREAPRDGLTTCAAAARTAFAS